MATNYQKYVSLSRDQIDFIRDNAANMTQKEMAKKFGCSQGKICENARLAGIVFPDRNANTPVSGKLIEGKFFDADTDVMFGFKKGKVY